jgi:hypothetical protein
MPITNKIDLLANAIAVQDASLLMVDIFLG